MLNVAVGQTVTRWLAGEIPLKLRVTAVTEDIINCGGESGWNFDRQTGAEIDEFLGWGAPPKMTGSYITVERAA
jgi:hypothetical protein